MRRLNVAWVVGVFLGMCLQTAAALDRPVEIEHSVPRTHATEPTSEDRTKMQNALLAGALGQHDAAIREFDDVLARNPDCVEAYKLRATVRVLGRDYRGAVADLEQIIARVPKEADAYLMAGVFLWHNGKWEDALKMYDRLIAVNPTSEEAYTQRGALQLKKGNRQAADADIQKALQINPKHVNALVLRGNLRYSTGDASGALSDYGSALAVEPKNVEALISATQLLSRCGNAKLRDGNRALEYGKKAVEASNETNYWALDALASAHAELGQFTEAIATADKALKLAEPQVPDFKTIQARRELYQASKPFRD